MLALTIADNSYMGLESVSLIDLGTRWQHTRSFMRLMPMGRTGLPSDSGQGSVAVERPGYALRFDNDGTRRELTVRVDDFREHKPLTARVTLTGVPQDSMVIATPFTGHPRAFYYNQKINCLKAAGEVVFDGETAGLTRRPPRRCWTGAGACGPIKTPGTGAAPAAMWTACPLG